MLYVSLKNITVSSPLKLKEVKMTREADTKCEQIHQHT